MDEMIRLRAPAKLNLYLRVLGQRPDGYHELETVFERIDLADELTFEPSPQGLALTCDEPTLPVDDENLIVKAARLLQQTAGTTQARPGSLKGRAGGAKIHLHKRIPIAAGLGGGSSDAATTLLGLNELWKLRLERTALLQLGAQVGSDVPFFLSQAAFAIGRGRGEVCEPLIPGASLTHILVVPGVRLSTRDVYDGLRRTAAQFGPSAGAQGRILSKVEGFGLTVPHPSITMVLHALSNGSLGELAKGLWNDLEPEAIRRCPISTLIRSRLQEYKCLGTLVSGSGPAVFGLCQDLAHAQCVATGLQTHARTSWRIEIVRTLHAGGAGFEPSNVQDQYRAPVNMS